MHTIYPYEYCEWYYRGVLISPSSPGPIDYCAGSLFCFSQGNYERTTFDSNIGSITKGWTAPIESLRTSNGSENIAIPMVNKLSPLA